MTVPTVVIMPRKKAAHVVHKRRPRPPWGQLLGSKPIERHLFLRDEKIDLGEESTQESQYLRMLLLRNHYGIGGPIPRYPVAGLVDTSWLCWSKEHDELATIHSITSSARASSIGGISRPSALAVARLITSSKRVGCTTGRSAGFAPLRMRPV